MMGDFLRSLDSFVEFDVVFCVGLDDLVDDSLVEAAFGR